jgi:AraC family transcriptional regulator
MNELLEIDTFTTDGTTEVVPVVVVKPTVVIVAKPSAIDFGPVSSTLSRVEYSSDDVALCRPQHLEWVRWRTPLRMTSVRLSESVLEAISDEAGTRSTLEPTPLLKDERVQRLMELIRLEFEGHSQSPRIYRESLAHALASALTDARGKISGTSPRLQGLAPRQLRRVVDYVQEHFEKDISLRRLAEVAGISSAYFSRLFHQSQGLSPHRFLIKVRIEKARELLRQRSPTVLGVAIATGFQTQQHFARVFRAEVGVSPSEYRRDVLWMPGVTVPPGGDALVPSAVEE